MTASRPWGPVKLLGVLGFVLVAIPTLSIGGAAWYVHRRAYRGERLGQSCTYSGQCASAPCIHDGAGSYCSQLCESDGDCPAAYVCEPTRRGRRHACMKAMVDNGSGVTRRSR